MSMCSCAVCVTTFNTGGKFRLVSNFTCHTVTVAAHSYALLPQLIMLFTANYLRGIVMVMVFIILPR